MRWGSAAFVAFALCTGGSAAGCGVDEREQAVRESIAGMRDAYLREDYAGVCAHMSDRARRLVGDVAHQTPTNCPADVAAIFSAAVLSARERAVPEIRDVEVDGDRATALLLLPGGTPEKVRLVSDGGRWKVDQVFGTSAPPDPSF